MATITFQQVIEGPWMKADKFHCKLSLLSTVFTQVRLRCLIKVCDFRFHADCYSLEGPSSVKKLVQSTEQAYFSQNASLNSDTPRSVCKLGCNLTFQHASSIQKCTFGIIDNIDSHNLKILHAFL